MKFEEINLFEDRIGDIIAKFKPKIDAKFNNENATDWLVQQDPTPNKGYLDWILSRAMSDGIPKEDWPKIRETLALFNQIVKTSPKLKNYRDISRFKSLAELIDIMERAGLFQEKPVKLSGKDFIIKKYERQVNDKFKDPTAMDHLIELDPTPNKRYLNWLVVRALSPGKDEIGQWRAGSALPKEDWYKVNPQLALFDEKKNLLPAEKRSIEVYRNLPDLVATMAEYNFYPEEEKPIIDATEEEKAEADSVILYNGSDGKIVIPYSREASCYYGNGTTWCTAAEIHSNAFYSYSSNPLIYVIHSDKRYKAVDSKYAFQKKNGHIDTYNAADQTVPFHSIINGHKPTDGPLYQFLHEIMILFEDKNFKDSDDVINAIVKHAKDQSYKICEQKDGRIIIPKSALSKYFYGSGVIPTVPTVYIIPYNETGNVINRYGISKDNGVIRLTDMFHKPVSFEEIISGHGPTGSVFYGSIYAVAKLFSNPEFKNSSEVISAMKKAGMIH